jgi:hypothetical protein
VARVTPQDGQDFTEQVNRAVLWIKHQKKLTTIIIHRGAIPLQRQDKVNDLVQSRTVYGWSVVVAENLTILCAQVEIDFESMKPFAYRKTDVLKRELSAGRMVMDDDIGVRKFSNITHKQTSIVPFSKLLKGEFNEPTWDIHVFGGVPISFNTFPT